MIQILKFGATWCGPCRNLAKQLEGTDLPIINYDVDSEEAEPFIDKYNIRNVPVLIFTDETGTELKRLVGAASKQTIINTYNSLNNGISDNLES